MLEEAEVGRATCNFVSKVAVLGYLEKVLFLHLLCRKELIDVFAYFQEHTFFPLLCQIFHELCVEEWIGVLKLVLCSIPQGNLLSMNVGKHHVDCVDELVNAHPLHIPRRISCDFPQESLLTLFPFLNGGEHSADFVDVELPVLCVD